MILAVGLNAVFATPSFAGCLCNALATYILSGGSLLFVSFIAGALLMLLQRNWHYSKRLALAGAVLLALAVAMSAALNSNLWYSPGVIANSEAWLEGGVPAHWISLLVIAIGFGLLFIACSMLPSVIAFRRQLENRNVIGTLNILILLIPAAFVMAPLLFQDLASSFVMMFWSTLFTNPKLLSQIPENLHTSITVWSILLGVFAIAWGKLLFEASQLKDVVVVKEAS
ncbi:MAG: hypothetical protein P4L53_28950 [Candidatus Obscuribacterales bacterium]|nr:hypothetical protein [Candidatus Obscuribacterales bacterium]